MRTLNLNKTDIWYVDFLGEQRVTDEDGYFTGEYEDTYSEPTKIQLNIHSGSSSVKEELFGKDNQLDIVCSTPIGDLEKNTLIFLEEPSGNYDETYDFKVVKKFKSLNHYNYGFRGRL